MVDQIKPTEGTTSLPEKDDGLNWLREMANNQGNPDELAAAVEKVATGEPPEETKPSTPEDLDTKPEKAEEADQKQETPPNEGPSREELVAKMQAEGVEEMVAVRLANMLLNGEPIPKRFELKVKSVLQSMGLPVETKSLEDGSSKYILQGKPEAQSAENSELSQPEEGQSPKNAEQAPETPKEEPIKISEQLGFLSEFLEDDDGAYQIGTQNIASKQTIKFAQENPDIFTVRDGENGQKIIAFTPDGRARLQQRLHQVEGQLGNTSDDDRKRSSLIQIQEKLQELIDQEQIKDVPPPPGPGLEAFPRSRRAGSDLPADASTRDYGEPPAIEPSPNGQKGGGQPEATLTPEQAAQKAIDELRNEAISKFNRTSQPRDVFMIDPAKLPQVPKEPDNFYNLFDSIIDRIKNLGYSGALQLPISTMTHVNNPKNWENLASTYNQLANPIHRKELEAAGITLGNPSIDKYTSSHGETYNFGVVISIDQDKLDRYRGVEAKQASKPPIKKLTDADGIPLPTEAEQSGQVPTPADDLGILDNEEDNLAFTPQETADFLKPVSAAERPGRLTSDEIENYRASILNATPETRTTAQAPKINFRDILLPTSPEAFEQLADRARQLEEKQGKIIQVVENNPVLKIVRAINNKKIEYEKRSGARQSNIDLTKYEVTPEESELALEVTNILKEPDVGRRYKRLINFLDNNRELLDKVNPNINEMNQAMDEMRNQQKELEKTLPEFDAAMKSFNDLKEARQSDTKMEAYLIKTKRKAQDILRKRYDQIKAENPGLDLKKEADALRLQNMLQDEVFSTTEFVNGATFNEAEFRNIINDILPVATPDRRAQLVDSAVNARQAAEKDGKAKGLKGDELTQFIDLRVENALATLDPTLRVDIKTEAEKKLTKDREGKADKARSEIRKRANALRKEYLSSNKLSERNEFVIEARIIEQLKKDAEAGGESLADLKALMDSGEGALIIRKNVIGSVDRNTYISETFGNSIMKTLGQEGKYRRMYTLVGQDRNKIGLAIEQAYLKMVDEGYDREEITLLIEQNARKGGNVFNDQFEFFQNYMRNKESKNNLEMTLEDIWNESTRDSLDLERERMWDQFELSMPGRIERVKNAAEIIKLRWKDPVVRAAVITTILAIFGGVAFGGAGAIATGGGIGATLGTIEMIRYGWRNPADIKAAKLRIKELERQNKSSSSLEEATYDGIDGNQANNLQSLWNNLVSYGRGERVTVPPGVPEPVYLTMLDTIAKKGGFENGRGTIEQAQEAFKSLTTNYMDNLTKIQEMVRTSISRRTQLAT